MNSASSNPKISIIVPVYKAEKFLRECVRSILAQTIQDFELLLVDDGSPDKSGEICDELARVDSRIRVFHKKNGGVCSARNTALDNVRGDWVTCVDSDDAVEPEYLANFTIPDNPAAQILCAQNCRKQTPEGKPLHHGYPDPIPTAHFFVARNEYNSDVEFKKSREAFATNLNGISMMYGKLFSRRVIESNHIRFREDFHFGEDNVFVFSYVMHIDEVFMSEKIGYIYNVYPQSMSYRDHPVEMVRAVRDLLCELSEKIGKKFYCSEEILPILEDCYFSHSMRILFSMHRLRVPYGKRHKILCEILGNKYWNPKTPRGRMLGRFKFCPPMLDVGLFFYEKIRRRLLSAKKRKLETTQVLS